MKIKVHEREKKAMIRFVHPAEIEWFKKLMAGIRDSDPKTHPPITLKNDSGTIRFPPPKPTAAPPMTIDPAHPPVLNPQNIQATPINQPPALNPKNENCTNCKKYKNCSVYTTQNSPDIDESKIIPPEKFICGAYES